MVNKTAAERSAIARKAVETRLRNAKKVNPFRIASSNGVTKSTSNGSKKRNGSVVRKPAVDNDTKILLGLIAQKLGIEFPEHLKGVENAVISRLTPPPKPEVPKPSETEMASFMDQLKAFATRYGLDLKPSEPTDKK